MSLFRHADFRRLWVADTISQVGTQVTVIALPLVAVLFLDATTFQVGLLTAAQFAAFLLVGLPAGAWVDRMRRRPVLVAADLARALLLGSIPLAAWLGALTMAQLYATALLVGVGTVFFDVSYQSYLPGLVGRDGLVEGNAKLQASQSVSQVGGPTLGGVLVQAFTAPYAVLADAASFLCSAALLSRIRTPEPRPEPAERDLRREIAEGLRFVLGHRILRAMAGCTGVWNFWFGATDALIVVFLVRTVGISAGTIGVLFSIGSVGALTGAVLCDRVTRRVGQARVVWVSAIAGTPFALLLPLTTNGAGLAWFVSGFFFFSCAVVVYNVATVSFRQLLCPDRLLGRMNATMRFLVWGTMPLGGLAGGALGSWLGVRTGLWVTVIGGCTAPLFVVFSPLLRARGLDDLEEGLAPVSPPVEVPAG